MMQEGMWLLNEKYAGAKTAEFFADLQRLQSGEPLAYLIGHVPFLGTTIFLDSRPLIPRPETEFWVEHAILELKTSGEQPLRVLDLCAGSGAIGVAVLRALPQSRVDFVEIDAAHVPTIRKNLETNDIEEGRADIIVSDLFERVTSFYDVIFANPPYIDPALDRTSKSVRDYEPPHALYGGKDGMELIERILSSCVGHLADSGVLYLEHEPEQAVRIQERGVSLQFEVDFRHDQYGVLRYTRLARTAA